MKHDATIAIDPGAHGGMVMVRDKPFLFSCKDLDVGSLISFLHSCKSPLVVMESIGRSASPRGSDWAFAEHYGILLGIFKSHPNCTLKLVRPKVWQRGLEVSGLPYNKRKKILVSIAQEHFPGVKVTPATADALLIYDWHHKQTNP